MHWVKPKLVAEITYLTWTDGLLRHTVYVGLREDKPDVGRINVELFPNNIHAAALLPPS